MDLPLLAGPQMKAMGGAADNESVAMAFAAAFHESGMNMRGDGLSPNSAASSTISLSLSHSLARSRTDSPAAEILPNHPTKTPFSADLILYSYSPRRDLSRNPSFLRS